MEPACERLIMRTGIDPTVDFAFKRLFGTDENAPLLIHFLNAVLGGEGDRRILSVEFLTPIHDREADKDKLVIVDVRARDQTGRQIIVEMQVVVPKAFQERILYYWAKDYVLQLGSGDD